MFQQYCVAPVDAVLDETTYVASEESLGYGFAVEQVQKQLDEAEPGEEIQVEFQILIPEHTKASLEKDLFRDVLAYAHTDHTWNSNRTRNLELACEPLTAISSSLGRLSPSTMWLASGRRKRAIKQLRCIPAWSLSRSWAEACARFRLRCTIVRFTRT